MTISNAKTNKSKKSKSGSKGPGRSDRDGLTLPQLFQMFPDDKTAEQWFVDMRWPNEEINCPFCGSFEVQKGANHPTMPYRCKERECRKRFSVKVGTVMHASKISYQKWAIDIYLTLTNLKSVSSMKLHRDLGITQKTAWNKTSIPRFRWLIII